MNTPTDLKVTKRDGRLEAIDLDKIHRVVTWAADGLENVSVSQVELKSHIQFYNGIRTDDIHETIIKAAADLISEDTPDYQYLAARLAIFHLRKIAYGEYEPPHLYDHVKKLTDAGKYDRHILEDYSREEFDELNAYIDHERDMSFSYAAVKQLEAQISGTEPRYPPNLRNAAVFICFGGDVPFQQIPERGALGLRQTVLRCRFYI